MTTRTFTTSAEQDAAIAWDVAQRALQGQRITEAQLIAQFAATALDSLVAKYRDAEASKIYAAFKDASVDDRAKAKAALSVE